MTDQRTMRTFLDLIAERDEALGEATRLADLLEEAIEYPEPQPTAAGAAAAWLRQRAAGTSAFTATIVDAAPVESHDRVDGLMDYLPPAGAALTWPDPFHGHHPEHSTPQEGTQ